MSWNLNYKSTVGNDNTQVYLAEATTKKTVITDKSAAKLNKIVVDLISDIADDADKDTEEYKNCDIPIIWDRIYHGFCV